VIHVARVRQGLKCSASRTDGKPCHAWAIVGGDVCRAHGGSAPHVRDAAQTRVIQRRIERAVDAAWDRYVAEWRAWQADRIIVTAEFFGLTVESVQPAHIGAATVLHNAPELHRPAPTLRIDGRRRLRRPRVSSTTRRSDHG
jgi:hypothetical protein